MPGYAALLRGINVGGHKKILMADLRAMLKDLGFTGVTTLLQSGNVVFTCPETPTADLAAAIERAIADRFTMSVRCLVRTGPQLRATVDGNPFPHGPGQASRFFALFLSENPDPELLAMYDPRGLAPVDVALGDGVIYQWCPDGILAAPNVSGFVEKNLNVAVTARNWNTVVKLRALLERPL